MPLGQITDPDERLLFAWSGQDPAGDRAVLAVYLTRCGEFRAVRTVGGAAVAWTRRRCFDQLLADARAQLLAAGYGLREVDLDAPRSRDMVLRARDADRPGGGDRPAIA